MGKPSTSCDSCRRSRLGCNAASTQPQEACFNCARKGIICVFRTEDRMNGRKDLSTSDLITAQDDERGLDMANVPDDSAVHQQEISDAAPLPTLTPFSTSDDLAKTHQAFQLHNLLCNVYTSLLEPRIGLWIDGVGCPFVGKKSAPPSMLISRLVIDLDKRLARTGGQGENRASNSSNWNTYNPPITAHDGEAAINRALMFAIYAYSVRWINLINEKQSLDTESRKHFRSMKGRLACELYQQAKRAMYAVISKPCYRSILALYLFANIPSSIHTAGDTIADLCLESSLSHQSYLRTRSRMPSSGCDPIANLLDQGSFSSTNISLVQEMPFFDAEKQEMQSFAQSIYWFGIISDTTRALIRCRPSVMLPGDTGESKVWSIIRQRIQLFEPEFEFLRGLRGPYNDDQAVAILQHAFPLKTLVWAAITRVQDALVHQMSSISVAEAVDNARKESDRFEQTFAQLLCLCQRDFSLLSRTTQMYWTLLNIHFQVGNLILVDALPTNFVFIDQNTTPYDMRLCACRSIVIALNLALQTRYLGTDNIARPNILLLDPYPDLMANAIIRTGSSLFILYKSQKLTTESMMNMFAVVISALEVLAELSYTAEAAIPLLREKFEASCIDRNDVFKNDVLYHAAASVSAAVDEELFDIELVQQLAQHTTDQSWIDHCFHDAEESPATFQGSRNIETPDFGSCRDWMFGSG